MGFGLGNLKIILNTIKELAAEKGINYKDGVIQFFEFLEKHYDIKLRLKVQDAQQQHQQKQKQQQRKMQPSRSFLYIERLLPSLRYQKNKLIS
jgi:hypothetical protein